VELLNHDQQHPKIAKQKRGVIKHSLDQTLEDQREEHLKEKFEEKYSLEEHH